MGSVTALGIKDSVLDLETQILYHLRGNHYPPVPAEMVQPCIEAIDAYYDEDHSRMIDMPMVGDFQILYKNSKQAPAWAIVEQHHLEFFIDPEELNSDSDGFYDYINSVDASVEE
jgi:hypothetical protein